METTSTPLAIVGIGCLFPKADGPGAYWANIKNAVDCITEVPSTHWDPDQYFDPDPKKADMTYARRGGFLSPVEFNPLEFGIAPRDIEATDTSQLLGLVAAKQALKDAGVVFEDAANGSHRKPVDRNKVSVILGVTGTLELVVPLGARLGHPRWKQAMKDAGVPADVAEDAAQRIAESYVPWQENSFPGLLGNVVAGRIANKLDLGGTNCVVDAACASSLSAVHLAALELAAGRADVVVTGGADTFNDIFMFMCFSKTPALSPTGDSKPFDANGDGTILGEGLGMIVLKRLADAERDGDRVYAVLRSIGSSSDGKGNAIYAPSAAGQKKAIRNAYRFADVTPDTIELVEAHGTGTKVGDAVEASALAEVYGSEAKARPWVALGSVKSQIGHTKAAAGSASLIKAALALHFKVLPPTLKVTEPVEPLKAADSPFYVNPVKRPWLPRKEHPRRAAVSAFGFGGSNFHAVLEEYQPAKSEADWDGSVEIVALTGDSPTALAAELDKLPVNDWPAFARIAEASRKAFQADAACRLCFVAHREATDLSKLIEGAKNKLAAQPHASAWHTADGVYFGRGPAAGKLGVLFPGQGSQSVGMLRDLACQFPEVLETLAAANEVGFPQDDDTADRLSDRIYPPPVRTTEAKAKQDAALRDTRVAQPALGALELGLWHLLRDRFGVTADAFAGHSYGELTALAAAGRFAETDLFALSRLRGELMARQREGDPGSMFAVSAPLAEVEAVLKDESLDLVVANKNAPSQVVLSGRTDEIDRAVKAFESRKLAGKKLPVAAAFHSPLVADAAKPFRERLESVSFSKSKRPVFANTSATEYPTKTAAAKDLLANQLAKPVEFVSLIRAMASSGVHTFLEVGPGSVLTRLADASLSDGKVSPSSPAAEVFAVDASGGRRSGVLDLGQTLARLAALGHAVNLTAWEADSRCRPAAVNGKAGLTVPICGANYVQPRAKRPPRSLANGTSLNCMNGSHGPAHVPPTAANAKASSMPDAVNPIPLDANALSQALQMTQQTLTALQRMQEQAAILHRQFLESQDAAQRTFQALVEQQAALLGGVGGGIALPPMPAMPAMPVAPAVPMPSFPAYSIPNPAIPTVSVPAPMPVAPAPVRKPTAPAPKPVAAASNIQTALLAVVSEKTGYPVSSLEPSLSLDSDLGIDSIKRVEILSAIQEKLPDAPVVKPEHLGTLHTIQDVIDFLAGGSSSNVVNVDDEPPMTMPLKDSLILLTRGDGAPPMQTLTPMSTPITPIFNASAAVESTTIIRTMLEAVAEKTGYPVSSLELSLSLDSDLGIDSIKRVEILSALQEKLPDAPVVKPEHLGSLHTLQDVADFLMGGPTTSLQIPSIPLSGTLSELAAPDTEHVSSIRPVQPTDSALKPPPTKAVPALAALRGITTTPAPVGASPLDTLRQPVSPIGGSDRLDRSILQAVDLDPHMPRPRVSLVPGGEIWVVGDPDALTEAVVDQFAQHGFNARTMGWGGPGSNRPTGPLAGLVLLASAQATPDSGLNRLAFQWLQQVAAKLRQAGRHSGAVFAAVARLDGAFGLNHLSAEAEPISGGLAGLVKTARHEWPEVTCKAIDLDPAFTEPTAAAAALYDEIQCSGPVEVGIAATHRCTLELARTVRRQTNRLLDLNAKDVVLFTGGARGVTAEAAVALAETYHPTLVLTGRTTTPGPEPEWLSGLTTEAELKRAISENLGGEPTPRQVGDYYQKVIAQREVRSTLRRIEETGAKVVYFPLDVCDGKAVADLLQKVRVKFGPVTAVVHGAGVLADKRIEDLTPEQFEKVYATKVDGLRNILDLLTHEELKALVLFSSTTARFGRTGQAAYAVANEVLNKTAQVESRRRPGCRVVSVNWGPWDGGMVTPGLKKIFESEGVGVIPLLDGAAFLVNELNAAGRAVEVVALGKPKPTSGSGVQPMPQTRAASSPPMTASGSGFHPVPGTGPHVSPPNAPLAAEMGLVFERPIDVDSHPVLRSHVLDGRAVLPMAVHLEWLAHAALHGQPGLVFHGFNELRVTQGVMVEEGASVTLKAFAGKATRQDKLFMVPVELRGKRRDGREVIHSRAEMVLVAALPKAPPADRPPVVSPYTHSLEEVYAEFLFHGPELRGIERIDGIGETSFVGTAYPAPSPVEWFSNPLRSGWVAEPMVLDASFQMMILWSIGQHQAGSIPCFAGRYRQFRRSFPAGPVKVVIRVRRDDGRFARADIDYLDGEGLVVAQMQDYECVIEESLNQAFRRNQLGMTKA